MSLIRRAILGHHRDLEVFDRSLAQLLFWSNPVPAWIVDSETGLFLAVNDAAIDVYGYTPKEFATMSRADIRADADSTSSATITRAGSVLAVDEQTSAPFVYSGRIARATVSLVLAVREGGLDRPYVQVERLQRLAYSDATTGLPNRSAFVRTLEATEPRIGAAIAVVRFAPIEAECEPDDLAGAIFDRLSSALIAGCSAARLSEQRFALFFRTSDGARTASVWATYCVRLFADPVRLDDRAIALKTFVGIAPLRTGVTLVQSLADAVTAVTIASLSEQSVVEFSESLHGANRQVHTIVAESTESRVLQAVRPAS